MKKTLGNLERQLFAYSQLRRLRTLGTGDLIKPLGISPKQERELLSRLNRVGLIARVRRGLYLIPPRLPLGSTWSPDETLAINTLIKDRNGRYQISGPNAFNRYGFDEQIPTRVCMYNNVLSGERTIGSISLILIKVADARLGSIEEVKTPEGEVALYSSRSRALLDAVYDWSRFNTLPRAYDWLQKELTENRVRPGEIVDVTLSYGDIGTIRRIGFFLERLEVKNSFLLKLSKAIKPSTSFIPLVPNQPKRGKVNNRWGILDNLKI
jgi:predicted transcriptional regulator of viral defense system